MNCYTDKGRQPKRLHRFYLLLEMNKKQLECRPFLTGLFVTKQMNATNLQSEEDRLSLHFSVQQEASFCAVGGCESEAIDLRSSSRVSVCNNQILNILLGKTATSNQWLSF